MSAGVVVLALAAVWLTGEIGLQGRQWRRGRGGGRSERASIVVLGFGLTGGSVAAAVVTTAVVGLGVAYRIAVEERTLRALPAAPGPATTADRSTTSDPSKTRAAASGQAPRP